jgi:hypothetical protein
MTPRTLALTGTALTLAGALGLVLTLDTASPSTALVVGAGVVLLGGLVVLLDADEKNS